MSKLHRLTCIVLRFIPTPFNYVSLGTEDAQLGYSQFQIGRSCWVSNLAYTNDITIFEPVSGAIQQKPICINKQAYAVPVRASAFKTQMMLSKFAQRM